MDRPVSELCISPNSSLIAVLLLTESSTVLVYSCTGKAVAKIEENPNRIMSLVWSPDSAQLLVFPEMLYRCSIYNLANKSISYLRNPKSAKGCVFSRQGELMGMLERHDCRDYLSIYHTNQWKLMQSIPLDTFDAQIIKWLPNQSHILVGDSALFYRLLSVCPFKGVIAKFQPQELSKGIKALNYSPNSLFVAMSSQDERIYFINAQIWKQIVTFSCTNAQITESTQCYRQETEGAMRIQRHNPPLLKTQHPGVSIIQFSADSGYLACKNEGMPFTVWIWNTHTLLLSHLITFAAQVKSIQWIDYSQTFMILTTTGRIAFWTPYTLQDITFHQKINKIILNYDGSNMLLVTKQAGKGNQLVFADRRHVAQ